MRMNNCLPKWELVTTAFISCYGATPYQEYRPTYAAQGLSMPIMSSQSVTITYTNVLLFYAISFSVLIDCLLIHCVVFILFYCVAYSLFFI